MADEETTTTGTQETTTPAAAETAAAESDSKAGEADKPVSISAHEYGILRDARAREKALAEENERLRAEASTRTTTTTDTARDVTEMSPAEIKAYKDELHTAWKAGNRDAGAVLAGIVASEKATESNRRLLLEIELRDIPEAKRDAVKKYMAETGAPTPAIAYRLMRGAEADEKDQRIAQLEKDLADAKKGRPRVETTRIQGLPGGTEDDGVPTKTLAEYNEMMRKDPNKTIADRRAGKFRIKDS